MLYNPLWTRARVADFPYVPTKHRRMVMTPPRQAGAATGAVASPAAATRRRVAASPRQVVAVSPRQVVINSSVELLLCLSQSLMVLGCLHASTALFY